MHILNLHFKGSCQVSPPVSFKSSICLLLHIIWLKENKLASLHMWTIHNIGEREGGSRWGGGDEAKRQGAIFVVNKNAEST